MKRKFICSVNGKDKNSARALGFSPLLSLAFKYIKFILSFLVDFHMTITKYLRSLGCFDWLGLCHMLDSCCWERRSIQITRTKNIWRNGPSSDIWELFREEEATDAERQKILNVELIKSSENNCFCLFVSNVYATQFLFSYCIV